MRFFFILSVPFSCENCGFTADLEEFDTNYANLCSESVEFDATCPKCNHSNTLYFSRDF